MSRRKAVFLILFEVLLAGWLFCLPKDLFKGTSYATVVTDRNGELLGARIAGDQQWRFPPCDTVPERFATALIQFEDRHFRWHPGVNPVALVRAFADNLRAGHVVSGGSTLTMQVIRLSRNRERTLWQKIVEAILATRLEFRCSKDEILALYASHAPFGGNVVGLEAAAWRYFGRPADELSWAESATLAVLPNAPASIHPGKARDQSGCTGADTSMRRPWKRRWRNRCRTHPIPCPTWPDTWWKRSHAGRRRKPALTFPSNGRWRMRPPGGPMNSH